MKKYLLKLTISFLLALGLTVFLYFPIYQKVSLSNQTSSTDQEISKLDLPLGEDIREILGGYIQLPLDRHKLCLKNNNGFQFIHADSYSPGIPFYFYTDNLNQHDFGKTNKLGAMAIRFYYKDNSSEILLYSGAGDPKTCLKLEIAKLKKYASSTIEYSYIGLKRLEKIDTGGQGKLAILRSIVRGYFIDTSKSSVIIVARWEFFLATLVSLFFILLSVSKIVPKLKYCQKIYQTLARWFKKEKQNSQL